MKEIYIAHSEDKEKGAKIQTYENHVSGVLKSCKRELKKIRPFCNKGWYRVIEKSLVYAAVYHDLGKLDDQSQAVLYGKCNDKMINHVDAGTAYLLKSYMQNRQLEFLISAYLVHAHHIGFLDFNKLIDVSRQLVSIEYCVKNKFRDTKSCEVYNLGSETVMERVNLNLKKYLKRHTSAISGIKLPKNKINQTSAKQVLNDFMALKIGLSILCDSDHEDTSKNYNEPYPIRKNDLNAKARLNKLIKYVNKFPCLTPRDKMRSVFFSNCLEDKNDQPYSLIDGTVGIGKTFGLMAHSLSEAVNKGYSTLNIILPFTALIDQSAENYKKALSFSEKDAKWNINVIHSVFKTEGLFHRKYMRGFTAPINLTTSVNFINIFSSNFTSVFKNIHKFVGSIICIDEYHDIAGHEYWPVMICLFDSLVKNFGCKIIFSSGTPNQYWEIEAINQLIPNDISNQIHPVIGRDFYREMLDMEHNRVETVDITKKELDFKKLAKRVTKIDGSVFCIFNTKKRAIKFAQYLCSKTPRKIYVRYSGLCPRDRNIQMQFIKKDLEMQKDIILIATQGSDVGLDLSFKYGFKESSNYNSALQMKGRINRNCEYKDSKMFVFKLSKAASPDGQILSENPSLSYKAKIFEDNKFLWDGLSPKECTQIVTQEYEQMSEEKVNKAKDLVRQWNNREFEKVAEHLKIIAVPSVPVLIDKDIYTKMINNQYVRWTDIQNCTVNVICPPKEIEERIENGLLVQILQKDKKENEEKEENVQSQDFGDIYYWTGEYDPNNFGIMVGWDKLPKPMMV